MIAQPLEKPADELEELARVDAYIQWQRDEGVTVIRDFAFDDLHSLQLGEWPRKGGRGVVINIPNDTLVDDAHVVEIRPGGHSEPERHLYEELVYILSGRGSTSVWWDEKR